MNFGIGFLICSFKLAWFQIDYAFASLAVLTVKLTIRVIGGKRGGLDSIFPLRFRG